MLRIRMRRAEVVDQGHGRRIGLPVVDDHMGARGVQMACDGGAETCRTASDQCGLSDELIGLFQGCPSDGGVAVSCWSIVS